MDSMDKYIGRLLDNRYEILEVIGTGGMAVVYKARCHRLNRLVAIKILKEDYMQDEDFRRRFHSESQAVAMLSHPNIVSVYDVSTSIMADYIVMELIEGISLKQYMEKKGCLNWKETLHFAIQIAKALEHAHSRGIVHRDIKPHNIMVLKNGSVKVTDFGIARMMSKGNTLTKEALGSVHYISPEQAKGGRVDNRSDIYSLGIVMYEMMSGRPPYDGDSPVAVAIKHINGGASLPSTYNPNIPGGLEQIIMKAMAHEQTKRYSTATEMLRDMDEFRKDPSILFDYNTPQDDLIRIHKPPVIMDVTETGTKTTAERVVDRNEGVKRTGGSTGNSQVRRDPQNARRREQPQKRNNTAVIAIIACALVALIAVVVFLVIILGGSGGETSAKPKVEVPNFVGKYRDVLSSYSDFDLDDFNIVYEEYDSEVDEEGNVLYNKGYIMFQKPAAYTKVEEGTRVVLMVSTGKPITATETTPTTESTEDPTDETTDPTEDTTEPTVAFVMEDLVEMTEDKARNTLMLYNLALEVHSDRAFDDKIPAGCVISTDPAKGEPLKGGDKVTLVVSAGKQPKMDNFVGEDAAEVQQILDNLQIRLNIGVEYDYSSTYAVGRVISTYPSAGTLLDFEDYVTIVISQGPEVIVEVLPAGLNGLTVEEAAALLLAKGFNNYVVEDVNSTQKEGTVTGYYVQSDPGGDLSVPVDVESTIVLQVSRGMPKNVTVKAPTEELIIEQFGTTDGLKQGEDVYFQMVIYKGSKEIETLQVSAFGEEFLVEVYGTGIQIFEIRINGMPCTTFSVNFDE